MTFGMPQGFCLRAFAFALLFAKILSGCEINSLRDFLSALTCYNSRPCPVRVNNNETHGVEV